MTSRFKTRAEFGFGSAHTFGYSSDSAMLSREHRDNTIGLSQLLGAKNHRLVTVKTHVSTVMGEAIEWRD